MQTPCPAEATSPQAAETPKPLVQNFNLEPEFRPPSPGYSTCNICEPNDSGITNLDAIIPILQMGQVTCQEISKALLMTTGSLGQGFLPVDPRSALGGSHCCCGCTNTQNPKDLPMGSRWG
mmetsp:Transcript_6595/g.14974  ORF Transcript_6595/g.14974 Transcript_6595/m.14974 type:complete len:121 (-) Transcript_6595:1773-2135(-)